ncbi:MAG: ATP-binding protein [Chloroflexi bacterium HGW-Chloroflexi-10]|nr:MAG: ATP-binding protein [Chloroflexi bacterium HGW-Chloroflexi-10]
MHNVTFPGRYESLEKIGEFIKESAQNAGFDGFSTYTIETSVDEACSNIIEHAYGNNLSGNIEISVIIEEKQMIIIIKDNGLSFDPEAISQPNLSSVLDEREDHGLGIYMMKQWMDVVQYESHPNYNTLTLIKNKAALK